jgi:UDP-glucose 4-epimerase
MGKKILVTGGAGYIGSHACKALAKAGLVPLTFDNLSTGWADAVKYGPLETGDLLDPTRLRQLFEDHRPAAVMHFAAASDVGESVRDPGKYWRNNVTGSLNLIEAMLEADCRTLVFSSTCAVYGDTDQTLDEACQTAPKNAYGASKHAIEEMIAAFSTSHGLNATIFRYFNVAGADPEAEIGEFHRPETHLVPLVLDAALGRRDALTINGTDYPTKDGTCIRDYVHVNDLISAHVLGLKRLLGGARGDIYNLGTGTGFSVREVISAAGRVTNHPIPVTEGARRPGDAVRLVSGSEKARRDLGWEPRLSVMETMIEDAWRWHLGEGFSR